MYTPDPFKNYTPKGNPPNKVKEKKQPSAPVNPLSDAVMQDLEAMTAEELRTLIKRICKAAWGYGNLTGKDLLEAAVSSKEDAYEALKLRAFVLASNASEWREFHALATFWAEREKGKPKQSIDTTVTLSILDLVEEATRKRREKQMIDITPK